MFLRISFALIVFAALCLAATGPQAEPVASPFGSQPIPSNVLAQTFGR